MESFPYSRTQRNTREGDSYCGIHNIVIPNKSTGQKNQNLEDKQNRTKRGQISNPDFLDHFDVQPGRKKNVAATAVILCVSGQLINYAWSRSYRCEGPLRTLKSD